MQEMTDIERRAARIASVSMRSYAAPPIPDATLRAAQKVLDFHARGRLHLPATLAWARRIVGSAN